MSIPLSNAAVDLAHSLTGVAISFIIITSALLGARIYTRTRPGIRFGPDDWAASVAYVLATTDACVGLVSVRFSRGQNPHSLPITELPLIGRTAFMMGLLSAWTMAAIKISVAFVFVRLKNTKRWRFFLFAMITAQCLAAIFNTVMHATRYIPLNAQWSADPVIRTDAQVWSVRAFHIAITIASSINIATDVIFSLVPVALLRDIQRPRRDKIIVGGLMALGLVGSSASIVKTITVPQFEKSNDIMAGGIRIGLWSIVEEQLGLIAACVPCLKSLFQRFLCRIGVLTSSRARSAAPRAYIDISGQSQSRHENISGVSFEVSFALANDGAILAGRGCGEGQTGITRVTQYHVEDTADSRSDIYALGKV